MSIVYRVDQRLDTTFVLWHGLVTANEFLAHARQLIADPAWPPDGKRHLSDLRSAFVDASIDNDVLRTAAELFGRHPKIKNLRAAIVATAVSGMAGVFERFITPYGPFVFVFIRLHPAAAWLGIDAAEAERVLRTLRRQVPP